eukprot:1147767-Pelagomonas_calceolata.AAC.1
MCDSRRSMCAAIVAAQRARACVLKPLNARIECTSLKCCSVKLICKEKQRIMMRQGVYKTKAVHVPAASLTTLHKAGSEFDHQQLPV